MTTKSDEIIKKINEIENVANDVRLKVNLTAGEVKELDDP